MERRGRHPRPPRPGADASGLPGLRELGPARGGAGDQSLKWSGIEGSSLNPPLLYATGGFPTGVPRERPPARVVAVLLEGATPSPPTKSLDFRGCDSSRLLILRVGNSHVRGIL